MQRMEYVVRISILLVVGALGVTLWWWIRCEECEIHYCPEYAKIELDPYVEKLGDDKLTEEEYGLLYAQTGLSRIAVDTLQQEKRQDELFLAQERFFADVETECECHFPLFREYMDSECVEPDEWNAIPVLADGDILITFNSHFLGWRNGHAGIVVNAEEGLTVEAITIGRNSSVLSIESWEEKPSFAVMRLRDVPEETRREIAAYAQEYLVDIPYRLSAGNFSFLHINRDREEAQGNVRGSAGYQDISGTHCAHLIWYAYRQFGYDLDSDGGIIVTPRDIFESPFLEVIQVYGMKMG